VLGEPGWTSDPRTSTTTRDAITALGSDLVDRSMLLTDGANHRRLRTAVRDVVTPDFIDRLTAGVQSITRSVVDFPPTGQQFDLMTEIALPLPLSVASEWLGLNADNADLLRTESPAIIRMLGALADPNDINAGAAALGTLVTEFLPLAADRRKSPRDDLTSFISTDPTLELDDVVITAILIAVAGHETTANLLGTAMIRLLQPVTTGTRLIDTVDPNGPSLLTELLRLDGPVQVTARAATASHQLGDVTIAAGDRVLVVIAAANRDPRIFDDPNRFRLGRTGPPLGPEFTAVVRTLCSPRPCRPGLSGVLPTANRCAQDKPAHSSLPRRRPVCDGRRTRVSVAYVLGGFAGPGRGAGFVASRWSPITLSSRRFAIDFSGVAGCDQSLRNAVARAW
jgi:cytochrome P450